MERVFFTLLEPVTPRESLKKSPKNEWPLFCVNQVAEIFVFIRVVRVSGPFLGRRLGHSLEIIIREHSCEYVLRSGNI